MMIDAPSDSDNNSNIQNDQDTSDDPKTIKVDSVQKGTEVTIPISEVVRVNDKVFVMRNRR